LAGIGQFQWNEGEKSPTWSDLVSPEKIYSFIYSKIVSEDVSKCMC
jgi:hypothetical protein